MVEMGETPEDSPRKPVILGAVQERETWDRHIEFLLSSLGDCVGLGNVWRFPYVVYENGGGAFLIPYVILMVLVGIPMFLVESAVGQFSRSGAITGFSMVPICKGVGYISMVNSFFFSTYYIMFLCYTTKYFFLSFTTYLPWSNCSEGWGADENCVNLQGETEVERLPQCSEEENETEDQCRLWETPSEQFWKREILHEEDDTSLSNIGSMQLDLVLLLFMNWVILYVCMIKGIKSTGKVVYFTAIYPFIILSVLAIYGFTLDGAVEGLLFLFVPDWSKILQPKVWTAALGQMFFSFSLGLGGVTMYGSYNQLHNKVHRDAVLIGVVDFGTSILATVAIFNILGFLAKELKADSVDNVVASGEALMFHVVPEAILRVQGPQLWTILFFLMVYTLGVDSTFVSVLTLHTALKDEIPKARRFSILLLIFLCAFMFILGLPYTTRGGMSILTMMDAFVADISLILAALAEIVTVSYLYGIHRFRDDLEFLTRKKIGWFWLSCWLVMAPMIISVLFVLSILEFPGFQPDDPDDPTYHPEDHPSWEKPVGCALTLISILQVPGWAIYVLVKYKLQKRKLKEALRPSPDWGPTNPDDFNEYKEWKQELVLKRHAAAEERIRLAEEKAQAKAAEAAERAAEQQRKEAEREEKRAKRAEERERRAAEKAAGQS